MLLFNEHTVSFYKMKRVMETDGSNGSTISCINTINMDTYNG